MRLCRIVEDLDGAGVRQADKLGIRMVANSYHLLDRRPRAGRSRSSPPRSVLEKQARSNQSDPSRSPHSHSRVLESLGRIKTHDSDNSRMPILEKDVHITCPLVDSFRLRGRRQNTRLPRTLKVLSNQLVDKPGRRPISPRYQPPQIPDRACNTRNYRLHHYPLLSP